MQGLYLSYKYLSQWLICKKETIFSLSRQSLPIVKTIESFITDFCSNISNIILKIKKCITYLSTDQEKLLQVLKLMLLKQEQNLEIWKNIQSLIYAKSETDYRKFKIFFQDLDNNIEYYLKIKIRIGQIAGQQSLSSESNKIRKIQTPTNVDKNQLSQQTPIKGLLSNKYNSQATQSTQIYQTNSRLNQNRYNTDGKYKIKYPKEDESLKQCYQSLGQQKYQNIRQYQKKLVSERKPRKFQYQFMTEPYSHQINCSYQYRNQGLSPRAIQKSQERELLYRRQLKKQMDESLEEKRRNKQMGNDQSKKEQKPNKIRDKAKKYKYLDDDDDHETTKTKAENPEKMEDKQLIKRIRQKLFDQSGDIKAKPILFTPQQDKKKHRQQPSFKVNFEDSIQSQHFDDLGDQLDRQLPVLLEIKKTIPRQPSNSLDIRNEENSLEFILASSLMSSKKWANEDSQYESFEDSLENNDNIRQTGKFNMIQIGEEESENRQSLNQMEHASQSEEDSLDEYSPPKLLVSFGGKRN